MYDISDLRFGWLHRYIPSWTTTNNKRGMLENRFPISKCVLWLCCTVIGLQTSCSECTFSVQRQEAPPLCRTQWCSLFVENVFIIYLLWTLEYHGWILIFGLTVPLTQSFSKWGLWTTSPEPTTGLRELPSVPELDLVKYHVLDNKMYKLYATLSASKAM